MAELVPNCSHVLQFSDEEVECLQKVIQNRSEDLYAFYADQADPNILIKYPPHSIKKLSNPIIKDKESFLSKFLSFYDIYEYQQANYCDFSYFLLIAFYEQIEFPQYNTLNYPYYHAITYCLHDLIKHWKVFDFRKNVFPLFRNQKTSGYFNLNFEEANSIFIHIGNIPENEDEFFESLHSYHQETTSDSTKKQSTCNIL